MRLGVGIGTGLSLGNGGVNWNAYWTPGIPRNNIIGQIAVTKDVYDTNSGVTTYTVGASGADYTTLADAYAAASAGDVIEIIDDNITLADRLIINKGVDLQGKAIKIKGKTTKSTITLAVNAIPIISIGNGTSIEFENIIFTEPSHTSSYPFFNNTDNVTGFTHFINCVFVDCTGSLYLYNAHEVIYDGGSLSVPFNCVYDNDFVENGSKFIVNNVQYSTSAGGVAFVYIEGSSTAKKYGYVSVTNSDITTNYSCIRGINTVKQWRVEGNLLHSVSDIAFITGLEASGAAISTVSAWNESTTYIVGSLINYRCILYECLIENTDSAPDRDVNLSWRRARLITGVFRNNTLFRTTYVAAGHGCFFGYGCYDFIIENNIVDNYCYNIVVKGHNNIIRFNGIGRGLAPGIAFFSNDQAEVRNNTIRTEGTAITYGPNADDTEGLISTTFMDNIISSSISGNIINDTFSRWVNPPTIQNNFYRNRYFGESATAVINGGTSRVLSDSSGFTGWKEDSGETGEYNDPDFIGSNSALKDYYTPGNIEYLKYKDSNGQSIGAVDLFAL